MTAAVTRSPGVGAGWGGCTSRWGEEQFLGKRGKGEADTWPNFILQCGGRYKTRLCYNAIYYQAAIYSRLSSMRVSN